jgi:hypothetical protein
MFDGIHEHELDDGQARGSVPQPLFVEGALPWYPEGYSWTDDDGNGNDFSDEEGNY